MRRNIILLIVPLFLFSLPFVLPFIAGFSEGLLTNIPPDSHGYEKIETKIRIRFKETNNTEVTIDDVFFLIFRVSERMYLDGYHLGYYPITIFILYIILHLYWKSQLVIEKRDEEEEVREIYPTNKIGDVEKFLDSRDPNTLYPLCDCDNCDQAGIIREIVVNAGDLTVEDNNVYCLGHFYQIRNDNFSYAIGSKRHFCNYCWQLYKTSYPFDQCHECFQKNTVSVFIQPGVED